MDNASEVYCSDACKNGLFKTETYSVFTDVRFSDVGRECESGTVSVMYCMCGHPSIV